MRPTLRYILFQNNSMQRVMAATTIPPSKRRGAEDRPADADDGDGESRTGIAPFLEEAARFGTESRTPTVRIQELPLGAAAPEAQPAHPPPLMHATPKPVNSESAFFSKNAGSEKCIKMYYANITALSAQAKAFLATNYVNKFHLVGLTETHVVDKHITQTIFQKPR